MLQQVQRAIVIMDEDLLQCDHSSQPALVLESSTLSTLSKTSLGEL
jgi:hypothetical protein